MTNSIVRCLTTAELRAHLEPLRRAGKRIGFLATMGALHDGHISLAHALRQHAEVRVCSVFVNPTQFNDKKDYEAYRVNVDRDEELLAEAGVDFLFAPDVTEIYPNGFQSTVTLGPITSRWEGEHRPGHFAGVATVVTILLNAVGSDVSIFGEKDFQQLRLIETMVRDLKLPVEIVRGRLARDEDGLAKSSRNARLSPAGRATALAISRGLLAAAELAKAGEPGTRKLEERVRDELRNAGISEIDYVAAVDEETLEPVTEVRGATRMLLVARVEGVRLLDNIALSGDVAA